MEVVETTGVARVGVLAENEDAILSAALGAPHNISCSLNNQMHVY